MANVVEKKKELLASAARTATTTGEPVSIPGDATDIGILMNTTAYTSGNFTAKLQTSSDGTNWTDVTTATTGAVSFPSHDPCWLQTEWLLLSKRILPVKSS